MSTEERLRKAAEAGKRATASPMERSEKTSGAWRLYWLAGLSVVGYAAYQAEGWLSWALWAYCLSSLFMTLVFHKLANRLRNRQMLLAREQVHRIRQLDATNPVAFGLGHLFDADPGLDKVSAEAGTRFALARVNAVLDEVEASTPKPRMWGFVINDDGTTTKEK